MRARANTASAPPGSEALPRARRIGARRDFRDAYENGAKKHGRLVVVFSLLRPEGGLRLGITATRKAGGAVSRNRTRRRVREIFRRWRVGTPDSAVDLVVNISALATRAPYAALRAELAGLLERATADVSKEPASKAAGTKETETK
ncbi:MAG: ribonuclease P protein component [Thermoanaerobaculia bacterium]|nr:ribonuclease P protein component [Thermoanaerobaculia bacterium]